MTPRKRALTALGGVALGALLLALLATGCCRGHRLRADLVPNHSGLADFDFADPPCAPATRPASGADDVLLRYLGTSGLYLEWRDVALLTGPYFSNHGLWRASFGKIGWDDAAIDAGLAGIPLERVRAMLVGHAHFDHLGDAPPILIERLPPVAVYVNRSGAQMLRAFPELRDRLVELETMESDWVRLTDDAGAPLPIRIRALRSDHAPQLRFFRYATGEVDEPWRSWQQHRLCAMKEGIPYAFLIDLLDEDGETVRFRIHYQDAASVAPAGIPSAEVLDGREVDLTVLCLPGSWLAPGYPERLLRETGARHALVTHYEDFFRPRNEPVKFVRTLTERRANHFVAAVGEIVEVSTAGAAGPAECGCGPCGAAWSMPLIGEWLRFAAPTADAMLPIP